MPSTFSVQSNETKGIKIIYDTVQRQSVVIIGSFDKSFIVSFVNELDDKSTPFISVQDSLPIIMKDTDDNYYDITGEIIIGPNKGLKLKPTRSFMGYWFSWGTFFPGIEIYNDNRTTKYEDRVQLNGEWSISINEVLDGGIGIDGIPSLENPQLINSNEVDYLYEENLVLGYKNDEEIRAYPHKILDWHEIINDNLNGEKVVITYCPLTGTGIGWPQDEGSESSFGVSGLLYNSNLIPYDRKTNSFWSQIRLDCVNGIRKGEIIETIHLIETTWKTWLEMFPETKVVSTNTGFERDYRRYPYGDYINSSRLIFPIRNEDRRLPRKERVHGIIVNNRAKVYRFQNFVLEE